MSQKYFENLPNIIYNNKIIRDISRRAKLVDNPRASPYVFYPYEIKNQLRSDVISEFYYDDSQLDWLIYMSNDIIDPYYQWYLNDFQFEQMLIMKYGSVENAMEKTMLYMNNWSLDDNNLSVEYYDNNLPNQWKKYYTPIWGIGLKIEGYTRRQEDISINTNRIISFSISSNNNPLTMTAGEIVDFTVSGGDNTTVGTAEMITANSTAIVVQHCSGQTSANNSARKHITGRDSGAEVSVNDTNVLKENVTETEEVFWYPVKYFDYEQYLNEQKKNIKLVGTEVKDLLLQQFQQQIQLDMDPITRLANTT
jgi:hypothetical protein